MSEFSAGWLALREPVDAVSRDPALTARLLAWRRRYALSVLDLGSGTGGNFRFLAPLLGGEQHWRLVDRDPALLAQGEKAIRQWAAERGMTAVSDDRDLVLANATGRCRVERLCLDLVGDWERLNFPDVDLVTASALIDLASSDWLERLARRCWEWRAAIYIVLSYDGAIAWEPAMEGDEGARERVNRHQRTDKGFGPALGPEAAPALATLLEGLDYRVALRPSPWRLGSEQAELQAALLAGWVEAARQLDPESGDRLEGWSADRRRLIERRESRLRVGHWDLFAWLDA
jgi:SAM-dependent methyltransferase